MKISTITTAAALTIAITLSCVSTSDAQSFKFGDITLDLSSLFSDKPGGGGDSESRNTGSVIDPDSLRPFSEIRVNTRGERSMVQGMKWTSRGQYQERIQSTRRLPNEKQYESEVKVDEISVNEFDSLHFDTSSEEIYDSALDTKRNIVDKDSLVHVKYYDEKTGEHVEGIQWTSLGKQHSKLTRTKITIDSEGNTRKHRRQVQKRKIMVNGKLVEYESYVYVPVE